MQFANWAKLKGGVKFRDQMSVFALLLLFCFIDFEFLMISPTLLMMLFLSFHMTQLLIFHVHVLHDAIVKIIIIVTMTKQYRF